MASSSSSRSKERLVPRIAAKAIAIQKSALATAGWLAASGPTARLSTRMSVATNVAALTIPSGCPRSARASRAAMSRIRCQVNASSGAHPGDDKVHDLVRARVELEPRVRRDDDAAPLAGEHADRPQQLRGRGIVDVPERPVEERRAAVLCTGG